MFLSLIIHGQTNYYCVLLHSSMVRITPFHLKPETYNKLFDIFYEVVGNKDREEFNQIFFELLSPAERIMIAKRIAIIYLLMKNIDYLMICQVLKVSNSTVSKFKQLMDNSQGIVPALKQLVTVEKISLKFEEFFNDIFHPGLHGINWSAAWQNKRELERKKEEGI